MIILIGVMEYVVFVILFGFEFCMLFDVIGFELKRQKRGCQSAFTFKTTGHLHDCVWIVDTKIFFFFRSISI